MIHTFTLYFPRAWRSTSCLSCAGYCSVVPQDIPLTIATMDCYVCTTDHRLWFQPPKCFRTRLWHNFR